MKNVKQVSIKLKLLQEELENNSGRWAGEVSVLVAQIELLDWVLE